MWEDGRNRAGGKWQVVFPRTMKASLDTVFSAAVCRRRRSMVSIHADMETRYTIHRR